MKYILTVFFFFLSILMARESLNPVKSCPAYNNMKHTVNTHNVILDITKKYTILKHHKGQVLILLKGEYPAQRWVEENCFTRQIESISSVDNAIENLNNKSYVSKHTKKYEKNSQYLLVLSWHNAFCETHRTKKECKRDITSLFRAKSFEKNFILHGFWPQPKNKIYCGLERKYITMDKYHHWNKLPNIPLSEQTKKDLTLVMPGVQSNLHKHEWYKHGTCYGSDAEHYFQKSIKLLKEIRESKVGELFKNHIGRSVTLREVKNSFDNSFGKGAGKRVELRCKNGLITELWIHLGGNSNSLSSLLKNGKMTRSYCKSGLVDKAGFTKETGAKAGFGR